MTGITKEEIERIKTMQNILLKDISAVLMREAEFRAFAVCSNSFDQEKELKLKSQILMKALNAAAEDMNAFIGCEVAIMEYALKIMGFDFPAKQQEIGKKENKMKLDKDVYYPVTIDIQISNPKSSISIIFGKRVPVNDFQTLQDKFDKLDVFKSWDYDDSDNTINICLRQGINILRFAENLAIYFEETNLCCCDKIVRQINGNEVTRFA